MSEELKSNENVGALQPDALAQIASVDPSPAVGGMHPFTPAMLSRLKKQRQLLSELEHALKNHEFCFFTISIIAFSGTISFKGASTVTAHVA